MFDFHSFCLVQLHRRPSAAASCVLYDMRWTETKECDIYDIAVDLNTLKNKNNTQVYLTSKSANTLTLSESQGTSAFSSFVS